MCPFTLTLSSLFSDEIKSMYGNSPFAAYLDGCSIVNNHADLLLPPLAALCVDLQKSIPHAYVNTYLTPPSAAAVQAHADDWYVFVIQILGEKKWKVYGEVPFPNEQVGKGGLPVPASVSFAEATLRDNVEAGRCSLHAER